MAAADLINLHEQDHLYQGSLSMEAVAYCPSRKQTYFLDWSGSCSSNGTSNRLKSSTRFYYESKDQMAFNDLLIADLLALVVIYADLVQKVNSEQYLVSYELRRVHH